MDDIFKQIEAAKKRVLDTANQNEKLTDSLRVILNTQLNAIPEGPEKEYIKILLTDANNGKAHDIKDIVSTIKNMQNGH